MHVGNYYDARPDTQLMRLMMLAPGTDAHGTDLINYIQARTRMQLSRVPYIA